MIALQELLHNATLTLEKRQQSDTLIASIREQLEQVQHDDAEFALMIRCAMKHEFRY